MPFKIGKYKIQQNKKQILEIAFVLFLIVAISITAVLAAYVYGQVRSTINTTVATMPNVDKDGIATPNYNAMNAYDKFSIAFPIFDKAIMFIIIGLTIGLIVTSFLIPTHPVYVVVNIIGFIVLVFLAAVYSNTYYAIGLSDGVNGTISNITQYQYPIISLVMEKLPILCAILVFVCSIAMYVKGRLGEI